MHPELKFALFDQKCTLKLRLEGFGRIVFKTLKKSVFYHCMNKKRKTQQAKQMGKGSIFRFDDSDYDTLNLKDTQILNLLALKAPVKFATYLSEVKKQLIYMPDTLKSKLWFDLEIEIKSKEEVEKIIDQLIEANFIH